ncbi:hypothetical protein AAG906_007268 [Vitis piasezkii]
MRVSHVASTAIIIVKNFLVRDDATLQLTQDGDLILRDADGTLVWCTYTYGKSVVGLNLTETGNLVLFDSNNASVWQSFDHPTDSLVPGQILVLGQKLIATVLLNPPFGELNYTYPMICGKYGICSKQQCFCPGPTAGETRYFTPVNDEEPDLGNCSCKAAVFWSSVENGGACHLQSEIFSLMKDAYLRELTTFIKVQNISNPGGPPSSSNPEGPPSSSNPEVPQSSSSPETIISQLLSTFGAFMGLVFIVIIIGRYLMLKGKDVKEDGEDKDLLQVPGMPTRFSHEILVVATENFSRELGKGGFGSVFEGILTDGTKVAVKCINGLSQTKDYFLAEVETIGRIHHLNLVRLVGYCANKSNRCLVYEYMRKIILDIAKGLSYLHEECRQKIIHLDIKPQNILLDESFSAKVSDFGLSKLMDRDQSQVVTTLRGTPGYMAPEWLISAITEKVDVYSFGIVTLEIFEDMQLHGEEAVELMRLAAWCLQNDNGRRPSMSMVIKVLEGVIDVEDNLDYNFFNSSGLGATEAVHRREINVGFASPVLPSILSGPR